MKTVIIVEFILMTTFGYFLNGIYMQGDLSCRQIDFNNIDSVSEFETCATRSFTIKSYSDEPPLTPYRSDSVNYLSHFQPGFSCFSSMESFTLDVNTEFHFAIYLQSIIVDDASLGEITVTDGVNSVSLISTAVINRLSEYYYRSEGPLENVKIQIEAFMSSDARLAIEYLYITNTGIKEPECRIGSETTDTTIETTDTDTTIDTTDTDTTIDTTDTDTTIDTTDTDTTIDTTETDTTIDTTDTDTTIDTTDTDATIDTTDTDTTTDTTDTDTTTDTTQETTTEASTIETTLTTIASTTSINPIPIDSNDTNVWIILSFVFLLTTIVAIVALVYLIYLYRTALAMKGILLRAPTAQSTVTSLPRLTVETSSRGNQVIVGIEKFKHI